MCDNLKAQNIDESCAVFLFFGLCDSENTFLFVREFNLCERPPPSSLITIGGEKIW